MNQRIAQSNVLFHLRAFMSTGNQSDLDKAFAAVEHHDRLPKDDPSEDLADRISDYLNTFSSDSYADTLVDRMARTHRTLQQSFTMFVCKWLEHAASEDYRFDGRNEASHKVAQDMIEGFKAKFAERTGQPKVDFPPSKCLPMI